MNCSDRSALLDEKYHVLSERDYSLNSLLKDSSSSLKVGSFETKPSIFRTACSTVVWSLPPKRRPISGSERRVIVFERYMAICLGRTTLAVLRDDKISARLTLKWVATSF